MNRKFRKIGLFLSAMLMFNTINVPLTFAQENCVEDTTEINESKNTWGSNITNQSLNENQGNYLTIGGANNSLNSENAYKIFALGENRYLLWEKTDIWLTVLKRVTSK